MSVKSNKAKGIVAISQKDIYMKKLKAMTRYLFNPTELALEFLTDSKTDAEQMKYRLFSYILHIPKLVWYTNKYMNNLYTWNKYPFEYWLYSFSEIFRLFGLQNSNNLYFSRYKVNERAEFSKLIKGYYKEGGIESVSENEINALYVLFSNNILTQDHLMVMKSTVDGTEKKTASQKKIEQILQTPQTTVNASELTPQILSFNQGILEFIKSRNICKNCPLYHQGAVILDTNLAEPGPVDIAFIGLNPGREENERKLPFVGPSGQLLREYLDKLCKYFNLRYIITNTILCWTNDSKSIPNIISTIRNCSSLTQLIHSSFPSKLKVILGGDAMKAVGIEGSVTKLNGQLVSGNFIMLHPSAVKRNPNKLVDFERAWFNLAELIKKNSLATTTSESSLTPTIEAKIPEDRIITRFERNLTLFDIKIINEDIIYIMVDENGNKRYMKESVQFPIYLKAGKYNDCDYISNIVEATVYLSNSERDQLNRRLHHNIRELVGG